MKVNVDPADVMFGLIGMGDFFPDGHFDLEEFPLLDLLRRVNDWDVLFLFPIRRLKQVLEARHEKPPCF